MIFFLGNWWSPHYNGILLARGLIQSWLWHILMAAFIIKIKKNHIFEETMWITSKKKKSKSQGWTSPIISKIHRQRYLTMTWSAYFTSLALAPQIRNHNCDVTHGISGHWWDVDGSKARWWPRPPDHPVSVPFQMYTMRCKQRAIFCRYTVFFFILLLMMPCCYTKV